MSRIVLIAHAEGEEAVAENLAVPLRQEGYEIVHEGTIFVGESFAEQASKILAAGSPLIVCATIRALGTGWAHRLVNAAKPYTATRVFVVQIEMDAYIDQIACGNRVSSYWRDPSSAIAELVSALHKYFPSSSGRTGAPIDGFVELDAYQKAMRNCYSRLKLEELDPTTHDIWPLMLAGIFIEQSVRECTEFVPRVFELPKELQRRLRWPGELEAAELDEETLAQHRRAYLDQSTRPVLKVVNDPDLRRLVILGDPGSGKSTLLQYLLIQWAEKVAPDLKQDALPLLIELREYARLRHEGNVTSFLGYLHQGESVRWHFDQAQLDSWIKANPCVVMFDGLDEVFDPALRKEVTRAIHRFADKYPLARVLVTSRIIGYQHQTWRDEGFRHFMLQELEDAQIQDFLVRWHLGAYEEVRQGNTKRELLARAIADSLAIRQLAENPLLLTMMAILNRTQDLPRDRVRLYEKCAELLLHQWKAQEALQADAVLRGATLDFTDKRNLLLRVARVMQTSERSLAGNLIDEPELENALAEGLRGVPQLRPERAARALLDQLRGRNFMLCFAGGRSYAFVHRTFLEYFCALEIVERFEKYRKLSIEQLKEEIFGHWQEESWHEVLCLLAGMIAPSFVAEILEYLLKQRDPQQTCHATFLAARCVGEVRKRAELGSSKGEVLDRLKALTCFDLNFFYGEWDAEAMRVTPIRIRAVNLVASIWWDEPDNRIWLKVCAESNADPNVRQAAVRELARSWKDDPETLVILKERVSSDEDPSVRQVAVRELARGWRVDAHTLVTLNQRISFDEDSDVRQVAVQELARGWKDDPETSVVLKQSASSDEYWAVRECAMRELARGWKDDDTLAVLKQRVSSDEDPNVRWAAVQELARGWKEAETSVILKQRASSDEYWTVRQAAVRELARGWNEDPKTLSWLKERASSDEHWAVRQAAVEELAHGWNEDPKSLEIFKQRIFSDEDHNVRQAAVRELARGWKEGPDTLAVLKERVSSDQAPEVRWTVVQELARGWKRDRNTFAILKQCASSDEDWNVRRTAVQELARGWKRDPETFEILKQRATSDLYSDVREAAVQELARGWEENTDTLIILKQRIASDENPNVREAAMRELARSWKEDLDTLVILKQRIAFDEDPNVRKAAVQELARGWKEDPVTLAVLKRGAFSDEHSAVREAVLKELVRGWKEDPETLTILKQRVFSDEDSAVRQAAMGELVRGWKKDPETLVILKQCVSSDENPIVRWTAVRALARGWKEDAETFTVLKQCVSSDEDSSVRQTALHEVARSWKDAPETFEILKHRVSSDEDSDVRQAAVQELARGWRDAAETLVILKQHVSSDENPNVRQAVVRELVRSWKEDPETPEILKQCASSEGDSDLQQEAVRELARGFKEETLLWLKRCVSDNLDPDVRRTAVQELVKISLAEVAQLEDEVGKILDDAAKHPCAEGEADAQCLLGDVLQAQGKLGLAQAAFKKARDIRWRLAEQDPENAGWQRHLAVAYSRLGDVLRAQGRLADARTAFGNLAVTYSRLDHALQAQGKLAEAQAAFEEGLAIIWRVVEEDPNNTGWLRVLAVVSGRLGEMLRGRLTANPVVGQINGELSPIEIRSSALEDMELIASQERTVYSEDDAVPEPTLREWYMRNRTGFNIILYDDKKVGHLTLLPFNQDFLTKFNEGKVIEKDAKAADIYTPASRRSIKDLYVESLAILHPSENLKGKILIHVLSQFAEIVSRVCPLNQIRNIYALAATREGKQLLLHLSFSEFKTEHLRKDGLGFFCVLYTDLVQLLSKFLETTQRRDTLKQIAKNVLKGGL